MRIKVREEEKKRLQKLQLQTESGDKTPGHSVKDIFRHENS